MSWLGFSLLCTWTLNLREVVKRLKEVERTWLWIQLYSSWSPLCFHHVLPHQLLQGFFFEGNLTTPRKDHLQMVVDAFKTLLWWQRCGENRLNSGGADHHSVQMCRTSASLGRLQSRTSWEYRLAFLWEHMLILAKNWSPACELLTCRDEQLKWLPWAS